MKIKNVLIRQPGVRVIDIDTGKRSPLKAGTTYELDAVDDGFMYYVLRGGRVGAIERYWEDLDRDGKVELGYVREAADPAIDGVPLPITERAQLTDGQYRTMVIGHLVKGKFRCVGCSAPATYPDAIPVVPANVLPYSQKCGKCGLQIVAIWRSAKGGWLNLLD
jgi:hypothetical protein